jgi:hypothetical protein
MSACRVMWRKDEGRLANLGEDLIQPLCRRGGHGRPVCQRENPRSPGTFTRRDLPSERRGGKGEPSLAGSQLTGPRFITQNTNEQHAG